MVPQTIIRKISHSANTTPLGTSPVYTSTMTSLTPSENYTLTTTSVDPEVYRSRHNIAKSSRAEKWQGFTRAYWSIACSYCHKEVRFCCMCQGELKPLDEARKDGLTHLQCTACHRVVSMRFCSACGHQLKEPTAVDARMEIPGVNVGSPRE